MPERVLLRRENRSSHPVPQGNLSRYRWGPVYCIAGRLYRLYRRIFLRRRRTSRNTTNWTKNWSRQLFSGDSEKFSVLSCQYIYMFGPFFAGTLFCTFFPLRKNRAVYVAVICIIYKCLNFKNVFFVANLISEINVTQDLFAKRIRRFPIRMTECKASNVRLEGTVSRSVVY